MGHSYSRQRGTLQAASMKASENRASLTNNERRDESTRRSVFGRGRRPGLPGAGSQGPRFALEVYDVIDQRALPIRESGSRLAAAFARSGSPAGLRSNGGVA